jgi:nucleotide-binding universal stress UspA family protein
MPIVCGTDLSSPARRATAAAAALAGRLAEPLWLVHVRQDGDGGPADAAAALGREAEALRESSGIEVHPEVVGGATDASLVESARARRALLVVGSAGHARHALSRLSGTSERIARRAEVPFLVVRDAAPFAAWARGERPLRVLLGVDGSGGDDGAIDWVRALRRAGPCDVVVVHVYDAFELADRYGERGRASTLELAARVEPLLVRDLRARIGALEGGGEVEFRPAPTIGRAVDPLLELAGAERADLVVVGARPHGAVGRLSSLSAGVVHLGTVSVALVPPPEHGRARPVPRIRRVLVATDLTRESAAAVPYAYALAGAEDGAEVHLLHVVDVPADEAEALRREREAAAGLRALVPAQAPAGVATRVHVKAGDDAARVICETAERLGADVVCLTPRGRSAVRTVFGSTAHEVLRRTRRPVLFVAP